MKKLNKQQLKDTVATLVNSYNPYIKKSIQFFIDMSPRFIFADSVYTKEELDEEYAKTALKDIQAGYKDRMVGYYDKWYRYTRADEGRAYDAGVKLAAENSDCSDEFHIIPCMS